MGELEALIEALECETLGLKLARFSLDKEYSKIVDLPLKNLVLEKVESFTLWGEDIFPYYKVNLKDKTVELFGSWKLKDKSIIYIIKERVKKLGFKFFVDSLNLD